MSIWRFQADVLASALRPNARAEGGSLALAFLCLVSISTAIAQSAPEYGSRSACERGARFTTEQCANAFANAQAEWDEGTPRFPTRAGCQARFGRCQIAGISRGKPSFQPVMEKVVILDRGSNVTVLPVAPKAQQGQARFTERTVQQRKAERSDRKQQEAQKRWEAAWSAAEGAGQATDVDPGAFSPEKPEPFDPNWQKQEGVRTYPAPSQRVKKPPQP
jgi:uncharacterized protein YgiB involved in biofilm formation